MCANLVECFLPQVDTTGSQCWEKPCGYAVYIYCVYASVYIYIYIYIIRCVYIHVCIHQLLYIYIYIHYVFTYTTHTMPAILFAFKTNYVSISGSHFHSPMSHPGFPLSAVCSNDKVRVQGDEGRIVNELLCAGECNWSQRASGWKMLMGYTPNEIAI